MNQPSETPNTQTLSRGQLTTALVLVTLIPFSLVVVMYRSMPDFRDPVLDVEVNIGPRAWPSDSSENARVVPCVQLVNPTDEVWNYLNMSINHQFHFTHPDEVPPGGEVVVPLKFFHTKGNAYFPPESQDLDELTIYAQVPSGARAIKEIKGSTLGFVRPYADSFEN